MINKNIKALSFLLILTVLLLGAVSMVSAVDVDAGVANATATNVGTNNVSQNSANTAEGTIGGIISTSTQSDGTDATVGANTLVTAGTIVFDGKVYDADGNEISTATVDTTKTITFSNGVYSGTVAVTGIADLDSTVTYYAGATLTDGKAYRTPVEGTTYIANIGEYDGTNYIQTLYLPFTYVSKYNITISDKTIVYGDDWTYSGTINDADGPVAPGVATITIGTYSTSADVLNGEFTINNTAFTEDIPVGTYVLTVTYDTDYSKTAGFIVQPKDITLSPSLNATTAYYNDPSNLTVELLDEDGYIFKGDTAITYTIINLQTGATQTRSNQTNSGKAEQILTDIIPGNYIIRINAVSTNYNFEQVAVYYNVSSVPTRIAVSENPLVVAKDGDGTITITIQDNNGNNLTVADSDISVMVFDTTNVPVTTIQHPTDSEYTVTDAIANTGYYLKIDYAAVGYDASTLNVPIIIKEGTTVIVTPNTATYNYGGNQNVTVALTTNDGGLLNTTISILNDDEVIGTVTITDGVGVFSLGDLNLDAADDAYTLTFKYNGDDSYKSSEEDATVKVNPIFGLGTLAADKTTINYNVTSDDVITLNLTSLNGAGLVSYNGPLTYTINGENYEITMTNGVATIAVKDLEELADGTNTYVFQVSGNNRSNQVTVTVTVTQLEGTLVADNITAHNDTEIIVKGTIENAEDGTVTVTLYSNDGREIATYTAEVAEDGSFEAQFASLKDGNYTAEIEYSNGVIGVSNPDDITGTVSIKVEGASEPQPEPTPTGEIETVLVIDDFSEIVNAGKNLTGRLTDVNGTPIIGMHLTLRLTRLSNGQSKDYFTTTDYKGEFQFPINLAVGNYTAYAEFNGLELPERNITYLASESPVTPFYVLPENGTEPNKTGNDTTVIITADPYVGVYGDGGNFVAKFTNINGTPLIGFRDCIEITLTRLSSGASKTYTYFVPDYRGEIMMPVELAPGEYGVHIEFTGSTEPAVYDPASYDTTITVVRE